MIKLIIKSNDQIIDQTQSASESDLELWLSGNLHKYPEDAIAEYWDHSYEYDLQVCLNNRKSKYPSAEEFLNAYFDGGQEELNNLELKRLAVKAEFPKPTFKEVSLIKSVVLFNQESDVAESPAENTVNEEQAIQPLTDFMD